MRWTDSGADIWKIYYIDLHYRTITNIVSYSLESAEIAALSGNKIRVLSFFQLFSEKSCNGKHTFLSIKY